MRNRRNTIQANSEFKQIGCTIEAINASSNGVLNQTPDETQTVQINAKITNKTNGVKRVNLHYAPGFDGYFNVSQMFDDGLHDDGIAGMEFMEALYHLFPMESLCVITSKPLLTIHKEHAPICPKVLNMMFIFIR